MDPTAVQPPNYVPPPTGGGAAGGAGGKGPWIIGGAVILVGIIIAVVLILTVGRNPAPVTPSATITPTASASPRPSPTPTRTRSPRPSPSVSPSPSASPTPPPVNNTTLVRETVEQAAEAERPGQLKHVGSVAFMDDRNCATGNGASASARFDTSDNQPPAGTYFLCQNANGRWKVTQGPLYGE